MSIVQIKSSSKLEMFYKQIRIGDEIEADDQIVCHPQDIMTGSLSLAVTAKITGKSTIVTQVSGRWYKLVTERQPIER